MSLQNKRNGDASVESANGSTKRRTFMAGLGALVGTSALGSASASGDKKGRSSGHRRNLIMMIPDGSSQTWDTAARYYKGYEKDSESFPMSVDDVTLGIDRADHIGSMSTYPDDPSNTVTDSAAAGTAIATGEKTYNGAISVDTDGNPVETILEKATDAGYAAGLVSTTQITHATPASFASHVESRGSQQEIARQYIQEQDLDVVLGGDRTHFRADDRDDDLDLISEAENDGFEYVETASNLESVDDSKVLGLFNESGHLDYYLDRLDNDDNTQPGLPQMTAKAIELLEQRSDRGFFLMVEGGRIDHAAHGNDPAAIAEQVEHHEAVDVAMEYAENEPGNSETLVVNAADHETGGLVLAREEYEQDWGAIVGQEATQGVLQSELEELSSVSEVQDHVADRTGIEDVTTEEATELLDDPSAIAGNDGLINERAQISWGTGNHSGTDVPVYAKGFLSDYFVGHQQNSDLISGFETHLELR